MAKFNGNYSVYVGIDWANDKHDLCVQQANSDIRKFNVIKHSANTINAWIIKLHKQYKGQIAVSRESCIGMTSKCALLTKSEI